MTKNATMALMEYLRKIGMDEDVDFLQEVIPMMSQALIELALSQQIGANCCASRNCAMAASSPVYWSHASDRSRCCWW